MNVVAIHHPLRDKDQLRQNRRVPLHDMLERMTLCLLKVISPVQWVEPRVEEELGPAVLGAVADQEGAVGEVVPVLRQDQTGFGQGQVGEGVDHAIGRNDGDVLAYEASDAGGVENVGVERERGVCNERMWRESEEPGCLRVERNSVAEGRDEGPGLGGGVVEVRVRCGVRVERFVA